MRVSKSQCQGYGRKYVEWFRVSRRGQRNGDAFSRVNDDGYRATRVVEKRFCNGIVGFVGSVEHKQR